MDDGRLTVSGDGVEGVERPEEAAPVRSSWPTERTLADQLQLHSMEIARRKELLGFTPMQAIQAATRLGGQLMGRPDDLGAVADAERHHSHLPTTYHCVIPPPHYEGAACLPCSARN